LSELLGLDVFLSVVLAEALRLRVDCEDLFFHVFDVEVLVELMDVESTLHTVLIVGDH
jgi:hypothetical protein